MTTHVVLLPEIGVMSYQSASIARSSLLLPYVVAILTPTLALLIWLIFSPLQDLAHPYLTFFVVVLGCALYGGIGPGLLTTLLSVLAIDYILSLPSSTFVLAPLSESIYLGVFAFTGVGISWFSEAHRRSTQRATEIQRHLQTLFDNTQDAILL